MNVQILLPIETWKGQKRYRNVIQIQPWYGHIEYKRHQIYLLAGFIIEIVFFLQEQTSWSDD